MAVRISALKGFLEVRIARLQLIRSIGPFESTVYYKRHCEERDGRGNPGKLKQP